ncbi:hypothetical protein KNP414_01370 [Paenibacillus mucilaginosus KNP414]|uniref:Uncharacterized protein n=1 Tax=Paenibacillus mucilaginosus (strain KNP414) TaxID=1036673 RepID=F8FL15_PAEMK|nr:hypothetical protein KNP414_01370 [Paenibacillus mucilaginosus KNP414]
MQESKKALPVGAPYIHSRINVRLVKQLKQTGDVLDFHINSINHRSE